MVPVIFLQDMAGAAQLMVTLVAVTVAALSFLFCARA